MLYLTRQLSLHVNKGDRFEVSIIEAQNGALRLGISPLFDRPLRKARPKKPMILHRLNRPKGSRALVAFPKF